VVRLLLVVGRYAPTAVAVLSSYNAQVLRFFHACQFSYPAFISRFFLSRNLEVYLFHFTS